MTTRLCARIPRTAARTGEPLRPPRGEQVGAAGLLSPEPLLELQDRQREVRSRHPTKLRNRPDGANPVRTSEIVVERQRDEWVKLADPDPIYLVAAASRAPLPRLPTASYLIDRNLELVRRAASAGALEARARRSSPTGCVATRISELSATSFRCSSTASSRRGRGERSGSIVALAAGLSAPEPGGCGSRRDDDGNPLERLNRALGQRTHLAQLRWDEHRGERRSRRWPLSSDSGDACGRNFLTVSRDQRTSALEGTSRRGSICPTALALPPSQGRARHQKLSLNLSLA